MSEGLIISIGVSLLIFFAGISIAVAITLITPTDKDDK